MQTFSVQFYGDTGTPSSAGTVHAQSPQAAARRALAWATADTGPLANRRAAGTLALRDASGGVVFKWRVRT